MALNRSQFEFMVRHDRTWGKTSVVAYDESGSPRGAAQIIHGNREQNAHQEHINESAQKGKEFPTHSEGEVGQERTPQFERANAGQIPGQRHWKGGNFQPSDPDYIGWLHADKKGMAALKPMLGMAVQERGRVPVADADLTEHGSRFSRSMSRKVGIQGHPENPEMKPTVGTLSESHTWDLTNSVAAHAEYGTPAFPGQIERGIQTANAMAAGSRRKPSLNGGQFEQLAFEI